MSKIATLQVNDVKRVKGVYVEVKPDGVFIFGGKNGQGKTSIISAIMYALGGEKFRPSNFKREGSESDGFIRITFDDGIVVERKGKNAALTVTDANGVKRGQELLNSFVSKFSIDLPRFMQEDDAGKGKILLGIIGLEKELEKLDTDEESLYQERTYVGRIRDSKKKACEEVEFYPDLPEEEISIQTLLAKQSEISTRNAKVRAAIENIEQNKVKLAALIEKSDKLEANKKSIDANRDAQIENCNNQKKRLEESFKAQMAALEAQEQKIITAHAENVRINDEGIETTAKEIEDLADIIAKSENVEYALESTAEIEEEIKNCEAKNAKIRLNIQRKKMLEEANAKAREYDDLTAKIEDVRKKRKSLLDGADLPYPGLWVQNGTLMLNGKAWDCMSGSEQLIVGCAIARKINPKCEFVLLDKLEQFDEDQLAKFSEWCEKEHLQVIATRVSTGGECSVIIEDGVVKGEDEIPEIPLFRTAKPRAAKKSVVQTEISEPSSVNEETVVPEEKKDDGHIPSYEEFAKEYEQKQNENADKAETATATGGDAMSRARALLAQKRQNIIDASTAEA